MNTVATAIAELGMVEQWYTVAGVADLLGISQEQVRRHLRTGGLEGFQLNSRQGPTPGKDKRGGRFEWRIPGSAVDTFQRRLRGEGAAHGQTD